MGLLLPIPVRRKQRASASARVGIIWKIILPPNVYIARQEYQSSATHMVSLCCYGEMSVFASSFRQRLSIIHQVIEGCTSSGTLTEDAGRYFPKSYGWLGKWKMGGMGRARDGDGQAVLHFKYTAS